MARTVREQQDKRREEKLKQVKEQVARLKRAARKTPLVISAHSGAGMKEALRAVLALVARAEMAETKAAEPAEAWHP